MGADGGNRGRHLARVQRLIAIVGAVAVLALMAPPATSQPTELRAEPGEWIGFIRFRGADIPFSGSFRFTSAAGSLDGSFSWSGAGGLFSGIVTGPDTMPQFRMTAVNMNGVDIPDVSGGGDVEFTVATCERLEGRGVNIQTSALVTDTVWWATRADAPGGADVDDFFDAATELQDQVDLLIDDVVNDRILMSIAILDLERALRRAEVLAAGLARSGSCDPESYRSIVAAEVTRLLDVLGTDLRMESLQLAQVVLALVRGSTFSAAGELGAAVEAATREAVADRIELATRVEDPAQLEIMAALASEMGWTDLEGQAREAIEALG